MVKGKVYMRMVALSLIILLLVSCGSNTTAQLPSTAVEKQAVILSLHPGNTIKYSVNGSDETIEGVLQEVTEEILYVWSNGTEITIAAGEIDSLWIRERSLGTGVKTGAIIGFAVVTSYALLGISYVIATGDESESSIFLAPLLGVVGAVGCGGIGACVGAAITKWERLF